jgi:ribosomal-protein-alanine N-acetyltransferase
MTVRLRETRQSDYDVIASWIPDADACLRWAGPRVGFPFSVEELTQILTAAGSAGVCLEADDEDPCGFGQYWSRDDETVHLGRLIVAPACRGKGLGRELCVRLIRRVVDVTGARAITLRVYRDNMTAVTLYQSLGFVAVDTESTSSAVLMRMEIASSPEPE